MVLFDHAFSDAAEDGARKWRAGVLHAGIGGALLLPECYPRRTTANATAGRTRIDSHAYHTHEVQHDGRAESIF